MTRDEKDAIKERIRKKMPKLLKKISDMEEMAKPISPENSIGRVSRMDAINNKSVVEAALRTAKRELHELEWAEKSIDKEEYGLCRSCQNPINVKRLMLMPGAVNCMKCA